MSDDRKAYIEMLKMRLAQVHAEISQLEDTAKRLKRERALATLQHHRDETIRKVTELEESAGDAWVSLRDGVENAWSALAEGVKGAKESFRDEVQSREKETPGRGDPRSKPTSPVPPGRGSAAAD